MGIAIQEYTIAKHMNKTKIQFVFFTAVITISNFFSALSITKVLEVGIGIKAIKEISQGIMAEDVMLL